MKESRTEFWDCKKLQSMTNCEWELLCDGCAWCCVHKIEDIDTGEFYYTNVACKLLDLSTCKCSDYANRHELVPECAHLDCKVVLDFEWLPKTCAYRRILHRKGLSDWHPLISGDSESVHYSGMSAMGKVISEDEASDLVDHIIPTVA